MYTLFSEVLIWKINMLDKQGYLQRLDASIDQLATNGPQARDAYGYLRSLNYDPHGVAAQSLMRALQQPSSDLKTVAALALGRLGRGVPGVVDALVELMESNQDEPFVFTAAVHALATLQDPASTNALVTALQESVALPQEVTLFQDTCRFMKVAGVSLVPHLSTFLELAAKVPHNQRDRLEALSRLFNDTTQEGAALYHSFIRDGYPPVRGDYLGNEPLVFGSVKRVGELTILLDQRVRYVSGEDRHEQSIRSPAPDRNVHETRLVVVSRADGSRLGVAVSDLMTSYSMAPTFKYLAEGLLRALERSDLPAQELILGIFEPGSPEQLTGEFAPEGHLDRDGRAIKISRDDDTLLDSWAEGSAAALRAYLSAPPRLSNDLLQYLQGSIQDELIQRRCRVHQAEAPEHTLNYEALSWDFPESFRQVLSGERAAPPPSTVFADSFDNEEYSEFFGKTLPESIKEFLARCAATYEVEKETREGDERWLDWPSRDDLDGELIINKARPFELTHPREHRQLLLNVDPRTHGVFVCRAKDSEDEYYIVSNIPSTVWSHSSTFEWGYSGAGPSDFALNILNYFLPPGSDGADPQPIKECYWSRNQRSSASEAAVKLAGEFKAEFIAKLPPFGGVISAERIKQWLLQQAEILRNEGGR